MEQGRLQTALDRLWAGYVDRVYFDMLGHRILFEITVTNGERANHFELAFDDVASYFFVSDTGKRRLQVFPRAEGEVLEMTSVSYYQRGVGRIGITSRREDWVQQWWASANFTVELASRSTLFIEARRVTVNDEVFEVGYPSTSL